MKFILSLLLVFSFHAIAQDCGPVNLVTMKDSPFRKIPVYDQKDTNLCYAYSAAQLVDYHRILNGATERSVHPAWVALNYAKAKNKTNLYIGHTKEAIESLRESRNCRYNAVSYALVSWAGRKDATETGILGAIEKFSGGQTPVEVASMIVGPACPEDAREDLRLPSVRKFNFEQLPDDDSFEKFLKGRLDEAPFPVSIAYCSRVWKEKDYDGIKVNASGKRDSLDRNCDYHESLIVGKRKAGGSCQLLVRNSMGNGYWAKQEKSKCLCRSKTTGEFADNCSPETHPETIYSVEACWIDSDKLAKNTGVVTFME